jgi:hypothetical protein
MKPSFISCKEKMSSNPPYYIQQGHIYAVPIIHYNMEMAIQLKRAFDEIKPDCVAVELPETMHSYFLHAASRLPDISVVVTRSQDHASVYFMCEPCDPIFEGIRSALEHHIPAFCIDLDIDHYPDVRESVPDPYAIHRLGLRNYYEIYEQVKSHSPASQHLDRERELYMAKRLKELSFSYDRILFISGMAHIQAVLKAVNHRLFPALYHADREMIQLCTLSGESCRHVLAEWGYLSTQYEFAREALITRGIPDRQKIIFQLYKEAADRYMANTGNAFPGYNIRNIMKFARNYALIGGQLLPNLYKILEAAKGCVDSNYAYEVWELATTYPFRRNIDGLPELDLSVEDVWGASQLIRFYLKEKGRKNSSPLKQRKDHSNFQFRPPNPFGICSYPPEDIIIERFGLFLQKKGLQLLSDEAARTIPFSTSLEDGIDTKETIRHWFEKKIYVKTKGKPPSGIGSICVIFDEDQGNEGMVYQEKYPWRITWLGEHQQESDMSFYATPLGHQVIGPGISRCEYGGFMMSYPPRRLQHIWSDPDYQECRTKAEVLLMAAIDYAIKPVVVYVAARPPRSALKSFAKRFGKKIVYIPIGQLSPITLNKLRVFHVLDGYDKRTIADEYIF